jgi:hypothetical protein
VTRHTVDSLQSMACVTTICVESDVRRVSEPKNTVVNP